MSIPRQIVINLVEGDDAPDLQVRFDGLDLDDYSSITMRIVRADQRKIARVATPVGVSDSELATVAWEPGDLIAGTHRAEFELIQVSDEKRLTLPRKFPILLNVRKDLG